MPRRYLFGPVTPDFAEPLLGQARHEGACLTFNTAGPADLVAGADDSWDTVRARLPAGWQPDFLVVYLPYTTVPAWVWSAPLPLVALAPDAHLQFHSLRRLLPRCDLVLADAPTIDTCARAGMGHGLPANLFGLSQDWLAHPWPDVARDIDVLAIGSLHPAIQRRHLHWLGRLARLGDRYRVTIQPAPAEADCRALLGRARIVLHPSLHGECPPQAFASALAGALLFQERHNGAMERYFRDRQECVLFGEDNLEALLGHYLDNEDERRTLAQRARQRARSYTLAAFWAEALQCMDSAWPALVEHARQRPAIDPRADLLDRTWQTLGDADFRDQSLPADLAAALTRQPQDAALHNALGLVATRAAQGRGLVTSRHAEVAAAHFRRAVEAGPSHLLARLNLTEALLGLGQKEDALRQALETLSLLERLPPRWPAVRGWPDWLDGGHFPPAFDLFRVEWEQAAWTHAGQPAAEACAKRDLLRWRLHSLLAGLTGNLQHHYQAVLARPDLPLTRAGLGQALAQAGQPLLALGHLHEALQADPWQRAAAAALFGALGAVGDGAGQRRLARDRALLQQAAPTVVEPEDWFHDAPPVDEELASLVILCCNQVAYTRLCLESVLRQTRPPYELILVDNASSDGTAAFLEEIKARPGPERVVVLHNDINRGFPAGCNQGSALARGTYVVFLNNDTVVTEGWLEGLIRWSLHQWPRVGLVGAVTNFSRPPQQIAVGYQDLQDLEAFAACRRRDYAARATEVERLTGFCLLARRAVLQQVGGFDERFGTGFFDDDDLCVRVRQAGFQLVLALHVFIHHFGSRTFTGLQVDCRKQLKDNFAQFHDKWGPEHSAGYRFPDETSGGESATAATEAAPQVPSRPRVSLCMIVKNEEANLAQCLQSAADLVDEVIVVDTGSTDRTREVAARFGARVFDFPWCDSFAAARNESLRHATGHWIFWMDADDRLDDDNRAKLRVLFAELKPENVAYVMKCYCLPDPRTRMATLVDHVRLFRNHPQIRWEHRVHEQILGAVRRQGGSVRHADVVIRHAGYQDPTLRGRKRARDLRLLQLELAEQPNHPFTLFNLASIYQDLGRHAEAAPLLRRSLELSHPTDSIVRKLYALLVHSHRQLDQHLEAFALCREGRALYPDDAELLYLEALVRERRDDLPGAVACLLRLLQSEEAPHFGSVAAGLRGFKARSVLALVYRRQGRLAEAETQCRLCLEEQSAFEVGWLELGELFLVQGRWEELTRVVGHLEGELRARQPAALLQARGHLARREFGLARGILEGLVAQDPKALQPWRFLSYALLQEGHDAAGAEKALRTVLELDPRDTEAQSNLAVLLRQQGRAAS